MRSPPFTAEILDSVIGQYNQAIWPLPIVACVLVVAAVVPTLRPFPGSGRSVAAVLAVVWAWVGVGFHLGPAAAIDFAAPGYGAAFVLQALLLAWSGTVRGNLAFRFRPDPAGWTGLGCVALGVVGWPLLAALAGQSWPSLPLAGTSPDPTALASIGLLLLGSARDRLHLIVVPALWAAVAGLQGWMLDTPERLLLPAAAAIAVVLAIRAKVRGDAG